MVAHAEIVKRINKDIETNSPPIRLGEFWVSKKDDGKTVLRRVRIVGRYLPDLDRDDIARFVSQECWITQEYPSVMSKTELYRLNIIPEFNLRYVFDPEAEPHK